MLCCGPCTAKGGDEMSNEWDFEKKGLHQGHRVRFHVPEGRGDVNFRAAGVDPSRRAVLDESVCEETVRVLAKEDGLAWF